MKSKFQLLILFLTGIVFSQELTLNSDFGNYSNPSYLGLENLGTDYFRKVISSQNDMIYYVGYTSNPLTITVTSTTADGSLNPEFGGDYTKVFQVPDTASGDLYNSAGEWISFQGDKLIVGARFIVTGTNLTSISVLRINADGTLDTSFGNNGFYQYSPTGITTYFGALTVNNNNEIFIGGRYRVGNNSNHEYLLIKLTPNGTLDSTFANQGVLLFESFSFSNWISSILCLDNGQILIAGTENNHNFFLLNNDGTFDSSFGNSGNLSSNLPLDIKAMKQVSDGFIAAGTTRNTLEPIIFKFDTSGFDNTFGTNGSVTSTYTAFMEDVIIDDNNTILFTSNSNSTLRIFKTETANGAVPFDTDNFEVFESTFNFNVAYGITQLTDQSIIGAGIAINIINENSTGVDMYALKLDRSSLSNSEFSKSKFEIYPNPFSNTLKFNSPVNGKLYFYNIEGKNIMTKQLNDNYFIDTSRLQNGIYIIKFVSENDNKVVFRKLIKS